MFQKITLTLLAVLGAAATVAPAAAAAPSGNIVYTGDSYSANPDQFRNYTRAVNPSAFDNYPSQEGCLQAPNNSPRKLAARGYSVADWSCTAQTSRTALGRIDRAIATGDLHPGTRAVVLAVGMNNYGPYGILDGVNIIDPATVRSSYINDIHAAAAKIRSVAPQAKIIIPGQLTVADPTTTLYCALNVVPNIPAGVPVPVLRDVEIWNRQNQIDAASEIGATYVEIKNGSAHHNSCAPDNERWVAGIIDTTTPNYNMAFHPADAGSQYVADRIAEVL